MTILSINKTTECGRSAPFFIAFSGWKILFCKTVKQYVKRMIKLKQKIYTEYREFQILMRSVPSPILALFVMSVFSMNLLANKSITLPFDWLALDCGIVVSWFAFLIMDVITTRFGPKASTEISIFAIILNLVFCLIFYVSSNIPGEWGESFVAVGRESINNALDNTFGGTWYVLFGSTIAFTVSAFINNFSNFAIGTLFKKNPNSFIAYISRTYISTAIGQFSDNITFALIVSHIFFGWSIVQCITCAITGMLVELICEAFFSFFGFKVCERWRKCGVGKEYIDYRNTLSEV